MKSFLACLLGSLLTIGASSAFAVNKSRVQPREPQPKAITSNFSNEEAVPDPSDDIAASREWRDASGEHSVKAQLQSVQAGAIALKKEDGTISKVPLTKLHKDDQELVRAFLMRNTLRQIEKAVQSYRQADLGDTSAQRSENQKAEEEKLLRGINGRAIRLLFPITDVRAPEKGFSILTLAAPDMPGDSWECQTSAKVRFTKEDALKIGPSSVLIVEGKARVATIGNTYRNSMHYGFRDDSVLACDGVRLVLDGRKMTVQHGQKAEKAAQSDAKSPSADHGGITKSGGISAAIAAESQDIFDTEKSVPDSSDDIAACREWRNASGERSLTAELQSVEAGSVALKKRDGTVVKVPLTKLHTEDQALVRSFLILSSKRKIVNAVKSFFETDFGDTDARVAENEKVAAEKLYKTVNGRELRLVFPIKNVAPSGPEKAMYRLDLSAPDLPGNSRDDLRGMQEQGLAAGRPRHRFGDDWNYIRQMQQKLTKDESLKIGPSSALILQGKARVKFVRGWYWAQSNNEGNQIISWESGNNRRIMLFLDSPKMTVQYEQEKARKAASEPKDVFDK
jgi:hypothetical protein